MFGYKFLKEKLSQSGISDDQEIVITETLEELRVAAEELNVPYLGSIPIDPEMRKAGDEGRPFIIRRSKDEENPTWEAVDQVMEAVLKQIEG